ncbi:histidine phosphatase family protein [Mesobacillus harenae]|uniref:histidine phosphatase family protein n=1 Tax=Mesobacillus harenae TaxID=2213203 RepID=UPI00157FFFCB|nr:histidine phosphatase family protein [Mesobacillus harenae]
MKTIYLVRHASAEGQPSSAPLTEKGRRQARALIEFFENKPVKKIYSSPFKRAVDTIKPTAAARNLEILEDDRLAERVLSSVSREDWQEKLRQSFEDFSLELEGGESHTSGMSRAVSILEEVLSSDASHIILVSHGNLTTLLLRYFNENFGFENLMDMTNPDVYEVVVSDEQALLKRIWDDRI